MDTRYHRHDHHPIRSLAHWKRLPFASFVAAFVRWASLAIGVTRGFEGDVLGEEQWQWLERQLNASDANIHVVVSSIQVLTSNPMVESWIHFPKARERLLSTLRSASPPGLILISGDVHHADMLDSYPVLANQTAPLWEVTSSGLTHSVSGMFSSLSGLWGLVRLPITFWHRHRGNQSQYYLGLNFGTIDIDWGQGEGGVARVSVRDVDGRVMFARAVTANVPVQISEVQTRLSSSVTERSMRGLLQVISTVIVVLGLVLRVVVRR